jgi:hypothetical protein
VKYSIAEISVGLLQEEAAGNFVPIGITRGQDLSHTKIKRGLTEIG